MYVKLRMMNPLLRGADRPSYTKGSFPFSHLRVQAAIGVTGTKVAGDASIYWDQWVLNVIEDAARQVISQKNLDELWRPTKDKKWANALDKIAEDLMGNVALTLRAAGILVLGARVVNFSFAEEGKSDDISEQQVQSRSTEWKRKRIEIMAEAEAESERTQQEAHAYAESLLLNSIAEGLQKTGEMHPRLPRYVIAMRYLSALQDYIRKQPLGGETGTEQDRRMADYDKKAKELQSYFKEWQEHFSPDKDK
jgi:regulator of protease activity HflC (stomatin/prohibitin superfamily)